MINTARLSSINNVNTDLKQPADVPMQGVYSYPLAVATIIEGEVLYILQTMVCYTKIKLMLVQTPLHGHLRLPLGIKR